MISFTVDMLDSDCLKFLNERPAIIDNIAKWLTLQISLNGKLGDNHSERMNKWATGYSNLPNCDHIESRHAVRLRGKGWFIYGQVGSLDPTQCVKYLL